MEVSFAEPNFAFQDDAFAKHSDRLVRHLFDAGLRLHAVRQRVDATGDQSLSDNAGDLAAVLNDLDLIIRDAGLAMLALARESLRDNGVGTRTAGSFTQTPA
ncbi:hypothetical protein GCM10027089_22950 [Nocardia thraciensis]